MGKYGTSRRGGGGFDDWAPPGSVVYKDINGRWHALTPGPAGYVLKTNGPTIPPTWAPIVVGSGGSAHVIQDEGTPLAQRTGLDLRGNGIAATDDAINDKTIVTVPGYSNFVASGSGHSNGLVPDPGAVAGTAKFLREDSTWQAPTIANPGHTIVDESTALTARSKLSFKGAGVTATDNAAADSSDVTVPGYTPFVASGGSHASGLVPDPGAVAGTTKFLREDSTFQVPPTGYTTIQDEGTPVTARSTIDFQGGAVTVTDAGGKTVVSVPAQQVFGASGLSHAQGLVADPGSVAGSTRFLREDSSWAVPSAGSSVPNPSTLYVQRRGLLFYDDFGGYTPFTNLGAGNPENGWDAFSGTWEIRGGVLVSATGANDELIYNTNVYGLGYVIEVRARVTGSTQYAGIFMSAQPGAARNDNGFLFKTGDLQFNYHNPGLAAATSVGATLVTNTYYRLKGQVRHSAHTTAHRGRAWQDKVLKLTEFNSSIGPPGPGYPGIGVYGGAPEYDLFCVYRDCFIRVYGLSGTMAFRLFDSSNTLMGSSGAQINGQASLDIMTLIDCPFNGFILLYTDTTYGTQVTDARFPSSGSDPNICGGDIWFYQA